MLLACTLCSSYISPLWTVYNAAWIHTLELIQLGGGHYNNNPLPLSLKRPPPYIR